jgi:glutamine amidotransferase
VCRHLAYLGPPTSLVELLVAPAHSLVEQARAPRHQLGGDRNPDGYGIGWYDEEGAPHRHRRTSPIWDELQLPALLAPIRSGAVVAAVRLASPGSIVETESTAPLEVDGWMFSFNGYVKGYHEGVGDRLRAAVSAERRAGIEGSADTGAVFALVLDRLDAGASPGGALASTVATIEALEGGRLNLLLTDGRSLAATACGNSLFTRAEPGAVVVASEPLDDHPAWREVPDRTLVEGDASGLGRTTLPPRGVE